ncbi:MAG: hypothetical protein EZS28_044245, partial [Streblomastix strix]
MQKNLQDQKQILEITDTKECVFVIEIRQQAAKFSPKPQFHCWHLFFIDMIKKLYGLALACHFCPGLLLILGRPNCHRG